MADTDVNPYRGPRRSANADDPPPPREPAWRRTRNDGIGGAPSVIVLMTTLTRRPRQCAAAGPCPAPVEQDGDGLYHALGWRIGPQHTGHQSLRASLAASFTLDDVTR